MRRQVVIDDGYEYEAPCLHQRCDACGWGTKLGSDELERCPECKKPLDPPTRIQFGPVFISRYARNFVFGIATEYCSGFCESIALQAADATDALKFMARRFKPDWNRGLPTVHDIRRLIQQALAALDGGHPDLARMALVELLGELDSRGKPPASAPIETRP